MVRQQSKLNGQEIPENKLIFSCIVYVATPIYICTDMNGIGPSFILFSTFRHISKTFNKNTAASGGSDLKTTRGKMKFLNDIIFFNRSQ